MIGHLIGELFRARQLFLLSRIKEVSVPINSTEFTILINLFFQGELTPKELEIAIQINKSNVTRMVKLLETKELVIIVPSQEDRRSIIVSLNKKQKMFVKNELLPITEELDTLFSKEQESALGKMVDTLNKVDENENFTSNS